MNFLWYFFQLFHKILYDFTLRNFKTFWVIFVFLFEQFDDILSNLRYRSFFSIFIEILQILLEFGRFLYNFSQI